MRPSHGALLAIYLYFEPTDVHYKAWTKGWVWEGYCRTTRASIVYDKQRTDMDDSTWPRQLDAMRRRVTTLYRSAAAEAAQHELLPVAFEELQTALEELRAMYEELCEQHEHLLNTREHIEAERQASQDLFDGVPVAYLITSLNGTIRQANYAAAALFHSAAKFMIGRSLALFVPEGERRTFRERLAQVRGQGQHPQVWEMRMQSWRGASFQAMLTTAAVHGPLGHPTAIRWIVQDVAAYARAESLPQAAPEERVRMVGGGVE
jgi:two-component system, OmpR family, sensor histidine kinase VicK